MLTFDADSDEGSDVIGTLTIGNTASAIIADSAYLDSWLAGLLEGIIAVTEGAMHHEVDLVEEPTPLILDNIDGDLVIRFSEQTALLGSINEAVEGIIAGTREVLNRYHLRNEVLAREIGSKLAVLAAALK